MGVALVTGAGRGLGAVIARTLADRGWAVAVNDVRGAAAVVAAITDAGGSAVAAPGDITDERQVSAIVGQASTLGPVGCLVVNATGAQPVIDIADLTWQDHLNQLEFFVKSPTLLTQAVLPGMTALGGGRIVHIGSDMPDRALPGWAAYAAAKSAQLTLARVSARELGPANITVNVVAPGWIPVERHAAASPVEREQYAADVPLGRMGTPHDIAATVAFLASADGGFITGQCIPVNGGHTVAR